jgi:hypothetical protein
MNGEKTMITERTDDNGDIVVFKIEDDLISYKSRLKETNLFHSFNGKPAIVSEREDKYWYINGELHREDGPAIELANGHKYWYINGKLHRKDGPAVVDRWGSRWWYINGKRHREDGPAIEYADGHKAWWINGKRLTEQEFTKWKKNNENRNKR